MGLRFDAMSPPREGELAPLESYSARDGAELPVRRYEGDGACATTLLLLHGSGYHSQYLGPLASRIAAAGVARVYTPDLRGHGRAPGDIAYVDQLEDDVADLVAHIERRHPEARVIVGGHSSGGGLAVRFAGSQYGQRAGGILLLAPYLGHDAPTTRPNAGGWARPRLPVIVGLSILNNFGITLLNGLTAITFDMPQDVRDGTETLAYSFRLNVGYAPRNYARDLAAVKVPLLGLIGAEDEAFYAERLAPALSQFTQARVEVIQGAGHLDLPAQPATAACIADWLAAP